MNDIANPEGQADYRVLARKYRPQSFDDLIGQAPLVRTLKNALARGRLAHAFVLTGVRGVGKTTTARIIAKGLNCIGADGTGGPTVNPCGVCDNCTSITEDRHVDILEMDAASRTGVDDIRDIIEGVQYRPIAARYKVYIIDEVHMLSRNAFNALLKTLEEPPDHVKFIFATTEIRKVPITVLSRCQRFDLRRISMDDLIGLFSGICTQEQMTVDDNGETLRQIARAADGSARDGLSLLDQAMALATGPITSDLVQQMLGLADRAEILDLFEELMAGKVPELLTRTRTMNDRGVDPLVIAQDLLDTIHLVTRFKVTPQTAERDASELERTRGTALAGTLSIPHLGRAWQMILKGIAEIQQATTPLAALEMVLIRLTHLSDLPSPDSAIQQLRGGPSPTNSSGPPASGPAAAAVITQPPGQGHAPVQDLTPVQPELNYPDPTSFDEIVALFDANREGMMGARLSRFARPVRVHPGVLEIAASEGVDDALITITRRRLEEWTGRTWQVSLVDRTGARTLFEQEQDRVAEIYREVAAYPTVAAVLEHFPGATIESVRSLSDNDDDGRPNAASRP